MKLVLLHLRCHGGQLSYNYIRCIFNNYSFGSYILLPRNLPQHALMSRLIPRVLHIPVLLLIRHFDPPNEGVFLRLASFWYLS